MVINALFTHVSCCVLLYLSLIKWSIAKQALLQIVVEERNFAVKDFCFLLEMYLAAWFLGHLRCCDI